MEEKLKKNLEFSKSISQSQEKAASSMEEMSKTQQVLQEHASTSLSKQNQLLEQQETLSSQQHDLRAHTTEAFHSVSQHSKQLNENMSEHLKVQQQLLQKQQLAEKNLENLQQLQSESFENAKVALSHLLQYSETTAEQVRSHHQHFLESYRRLFTTIDKILNFHSSILGEFLTIQTILFYVGFLVIGYLVTATRRTQAARIWVFMGTKFEETINMVCSVHSEFTVGAMGDLLLVRTCGN